MPGPLPKISIVLSHTHHPGNIGASARAMKTMGFYDLRLVAPTEFPSEQASSLAAGAADVLDAASVYKTVDDAIADCTQVFATSARLGRQYSRPQRTPEQAAQWMHDHRDERIAILFGRERMGLSAEELERCQQLIYIPGNPDYDVLNLASAVQIICYECARDLYRQSAVDTQSSDTAPAYASQEALNRFYDHAEKTLSRIGFLRHKHPGDTMLRMKHLLARAEPQAREISMLRGLLSAIDYHTENDKKQGDQ